MRALILSVAAALLAVSPAMAQDGTDEAALPAATDTKPAITPLAAQAMYNFTRCVVEFSRPGAEKLLARDFRSDEYRQAMRRYVKGHGRCAPRSELGSSQLVFAGNLAEHLLIDKFSETALAADLARDRSAMPIEARSVAEGIALCIVMQAPQDSAALFRTEVMSDAEKAVLANIAPKLSGCVRQGAEFRTNRTGLRALLALAAYRIAVTDTVESAT